METWRLPLAFHLSMPRVCFSRLCRGIWWLVTGDRPLNHGACQLSIFWFWGFGAQRLIWLAFGKGDHRHQVGKLYRLQMIESVVIRLVIVNEHAVNHHEGIDHFGITRGRVEAAS